MREQGVIRKLGDLKRGDRGTLHRVETPSDVLTRRFLEMGLIEGSAIEVVHEAPISRDPLAVRVRGGLIAIRRAEAQYIEVMTRASEER
jgi:ferrous iron transport protein A